MKMTIIISILLFLTTACKTDTQPTKSVDIQNASTESNVNVNVKNETKVLEKEKDTNISNVEENSTKLEEEKQNTFDEKVSIEKTTATKSVAKPEAKESIKKIEQVEVDLKEDTESEVSKSKTVDKDKSIPKPENKEVEEVIEQVEIETETLEKPLPLKISHDSFDALLKKYVSSIGDVDYAGLKNDKSKLQAYLETLTNTDISTLNKNEKLAFWINAYNAFTLKLIVDNYPVGSITDLEGGKPWDKKWISLNGKTLSLNNIENDIIRPQFKEPRIHFAVNCAAKSCPPLLNKAWTAGNLEANFEKQTLKFINNQTFNKISGSSAQVSEIFNWYGVDFGDVKSFINKYATTKIEAGTEIQFLEYNWKLNKK